MVKKELKKSLTGTEEDEEDFTLESYLDEQIKTRGRQKHISFFGFTGTPIIKGEQELTKNIFGEYVSTYNFAESVKDKATVPLYYENRTPEVDIEDKKLDENLEELIKTFELEDNAIVCNSLLHASEKSWYIERSFSTFDSVWILDGGFW